jgi:membrane protein implicated in regulation of membrane protease activity
VGEGSVNRLLVALAAFAVLAGLAWTTLTDERIRVATLAILGLFAVRTWLHRNDERTRNQSDSE